jgi:hypothetical protein
MMPCHMFASQVIQKQMAIVAWQPGPNSIVQVPTEVRRRGLGERYVHVGSAMPGTLMGGPFAASA